MFYFGLHACQFTTSTTITNNKKDDNVRIDPIPYKKLDCLFKKNRDITWA